MLLVIGVCSFILSLYLQINFLTLTFFKGFLFFLEYKDFSFFYYITITNPNHQNSEMLWVMKILWINVIMEFYAAFAILISWLSHQKKKLDKLFQIWRLQCVFNMDLLYLLQMAIDHKRIHIIQYQVTKCLLRKNILYLALLKVPYNVEFL